MITCCEIALALSLTNIISLAVFAEYTIRLKAKQIKLEKKNGYEQYQIDQLKAENKELKELVFSLKRKTQQLQNKLERYEQREK